MIVRKFIYALALAGFASACSSDSPSGPTTGSGGSTGVNVSIPSGASTLGANAFVPNPVTITSGTTVTWTNNDAIAHTTTSDTSGLFDSKTIAGGGKFSFTFQNKGTVAYHCAIHPGMVGTIVVQ